MLTRYGLDVAIPILVVSAAVVVLGVLLQHPILRITLIVLGAAAFLFTAYFFRDPERTTPTVEGGVMSPADGTVVNISEVDEPAFIGGRARQVCIFMSPFNVHVNRWPMDGSVGYFRHIEGKYLMAFEDKSSDLNERTLIGVDNGRFRVLFKQIAGFVARRIVAPVAVGDSAVAGRRFGMIKFGSRVDVLMPPDAVVHVALKQTVTAGETVLATVPQRPADDLPGETRR
jgi:phosphatidylserine decarboxylase